MKSFYGGVDIELMIARAACLLSPEIIFRTAVGSRESRARVRYGRPAIIGLLGAAEYLLRVESGPC